MFGISGEHLLILGIVLLIFGPRRLPELGNTLGKAIRNFKDAISGVEEANFRKLNDSPQQAALRGPSQAQSPLPSPMEEKKANPLGNPEAQLKESTPGLATSQGNTEKPAASSHS